MERECNYLHTMMFASQPSKTVIEQYEQAHRKLGIPPDHPQQAIIETILRSGLDVEAIELALRCQERPHLLTIKCRILAYIVETSNGYYPAFVNNKHTYWLCVAISMALHVIRAVFKKIKGKYLVRKYAL